ncbi:MAG: hypothetical protein IT338_12625 [Thermomicrobiales bacterium]|nr:hypothetical protein [Thermomicrobiales bacterium]
MDHERFDELAKTLSSGASRRKMIGGAIAGLVGAGVAKVSGVDAKGKKKSGKRKAGAEFTCTAANAATACPGPFCCSSTPGGVGPACVPTAGQAGGTVCGAAGDVCRNCPAGTVCGGAANGFRCVCTPASCGGGCCIDNRGTGPGGTDLDDQCIQNGNGAPVNSPNGFYDGEYVCGTQGGLCTVCGFGTVIGGCCDATGACRSGTTGANCGNSGQICLQCDAAAGEECGIDQTCSGRTPPPGPCPTGQTQCGTACVDLATNPSNCGACGTVCPPCGKRRRPECQGGTCGCSRKRRKKKKKH